MDSSLANNNLSEFNPLSIFKVFFSILIAEIGDKTFISTAILASTQSPIPVFIGSFIAVSFVSIITISFGSFFISKIPVYFARKISVILLLIFGLILIYEAINSKKDKIIEDPQKKTNDLLNDDTVYEKISKDDLSYLNISAKDLIIKEESFLKVFLKTFFLLFMAEWGDKSQLITLTLCATFNPISVVIGTLIGHLLATFLAATGGKLLSSRLKPHYLRLFGGFLFIIFAIYQAIDIYYYNYI